MDKVFSVTQWICMLWDWNIFKQDLNSRSCVSHHTKDTTITIWRLWLIIFGIKQE